MIDDVRAGRAERGILVYAIGYSYRHAIELALKHANTLVEASISTWIDRGLLDPDLRCAERHLGTDLNGHDLVQLLERLESRLALVLNVQWIDTPVAIAIKAVNLLDGEGQRFRYPVQSRGRGPSFPPNASQRVDLDLLKREVESAIEFLTRGILYRLAVDLQAYRDLEEAWRNELALAEEEEQRLGPGLYTYSAIDGLDPEEADLYLRQWELGTLDDRGAELLGDDDEVGTADRF